VHIQQKFGFYWNAHVHYCFRVSLIRQIKFGELSQQGLIVLVGHRDAGDLGENIRLHPLINRPLNRATANKAGDLDAILVIDEGADGECLPPEAVGLSIKAENLFSFSYFFSPPFPAKLPLQFRFLYISISELKRQFYRWRKKSAPGPRSFGIATCRAKKENQIKPSSYSLCVLSAPVRIGNVRG
jgi:hypothetical protein